jgi:hypothetical protein
MKPYSKNVRTLCSAMAMLVTLAVTAAVTEAATTSLYMAPVTNPMGAVWLPDQTGGHLWISDHVQGFCRVGSPSTLDSCVGGAFGPKAVGQPVYDPATNFIYVPDLASKSQGVWRLTYDPVNGFITNGTIIAANYGLGGNRPDALALGPDGNLYVGFLKNGNIVRITTPAGATQTAQSAGGSSDGKKVLSLAFLGNDLYLAESAAVSRIANIVSPTCAGGCKAFIGISPVFTPLALASDGVANLYVGSIASVYHCSGGLCTAYTGTPFSLISGLGYVAATNTLYVGDDASGGALLFQGHVYQMILP